MSRWRRLLAGAALAAAAGGCTIDDLQSATAERGSMELEARFADAAALTTGHGVQIADVRVGTVTGIELDGHEAVVTMSIFDGVEVPEGTSAVVAQTSLLGENYLDLRPPVGGAGGRALRDGDTIDATGIDPAFEQVTEEATDLLAAVGANDLQSIVETGATAFGGRGQELGRFITDLSSLVDRVEGSTEAIVTTIDRFAALSDTLAGGAEQLTTLVDDLDGTTAVLAANREELVALLDSLVHLATTTNDVVVEPHLDRINAMLSQLAPILTVLGDGQAQLDQLILDVNGLVRTAEGIIDAGELRFYGWVAGFTVGDQIIRAPGGVNPGLGQLIPLAGLDEMLAGGGT